MNKIATLLRTHRYLKLLASVKLAIPLMIVLIITVAVGTIFESLYNSDYAKMAIYNTSWFLALLTLLWINILCAALSRWPFQWHHLGFVITHLGLLTLLAGAFVTRQVGLDATLSIIEGTQESSMTLPETVVGYQFLDSPNPQIVHIERGISAYEATRDSRVNAPIKHLFWIKKYLPFTTANRVVAPPPAGQTPDPAAGVGVSFRMTSQFFEFSEWLQSNENPSMSVGPAKLELHVGKYTEQRLAHAKPAPVKSTVKNFAPVSKSHAETIQVVDVNTKKILGEKSAAEIARHEWSVAGAIVRLKKRYRHAGVSANKIVEGPGPEANPAYEFEVVKGGEAKREILFLRFPSFSINPQGVFGLKLALAGAKNDEEVTPEILAAHGASMGAATQTSAAEAPAPAMAAPAGMPPAMGSDQNVVEFWVDPSDSAENAEIVLKKNGALVAHDKIAAGQTYETPWMGIRITLASVIRGGHLSLQVAPTEPTKGKDLPPSSIELQLADGGDSFWLTEGSAQQVLLQGRPAQIFFDRREINLPFQLKLLKFTKEDYPGTDKPMSYESLVELPATGVKQTISMNDPLKKDGFTIYQSSFVMDEGKRPESVFSVNNDPGRPMKYSGSLILACGIIIFTVMRSDWWLVRQRKKRAA